jgi:K+-transporting ATPase ATPase C chain
MLRQLRPPVVMLLGFTLITGLIYPLAVSGFAWIMMQDAALGSLVVKNGKVVGSSLVGQDFTSDRYFHPRPSATDPPYNAAATTGSNLGPITQALLDRTKASVDALRRQGVAGPIPVDSVTASGSGLDPDISPETARMQVPRVAKARGLPEDRVRALVSARTEGRALGFLGEPHVNVLALNIALDSLRE